MTAYLKCEGHPALKYTRHTVISSNSYSFRIESPTPLLALLSKYTLISHYTLHLLFKTITFPALDSPLSVAPLIDWANIRLSISLSLSSDIINKQ